MNSIEIETARSIATEFATWLNAEPREAQYWSALDANDDLPEFEYVALREQFGQVTPEMERAYKDAFNATFRPIGNAE